MSITTLLEIRVHMLQDVNNPFQNLACIDVKYEQLSAH